MPESIKYFAYGSNLLPLRLLQRVPSSRALGQACLRGHQLHFHKIGQDGSGKCNVLHTGQTEHQVIGVVYEMLADERGLLDEAEGLGNGYELAHHQVLAEAETHQVFLYVAPAEYIDDNLAPFCWYKELVVEGARRHGLPDHYMESLHQVLAHPDPDETRRRLHQRIVLDSV